MMRYWLLSGLLFLMGCGHSSSKKTPAQKYSFRMEASPFFPKEWTHQFSAPQSQLEYVVHTESLFDSNDVVGVEVVDTDKGKALLFYMPLSDHSKLLKLTAQNVGKKLILVDKGKALGLHSIEQPIEDGKLIVFLEMPDEKLQGWIQKRSR